MRNRFGVALALGLGVLPRSAAAQGVCAEAARTPSVGGWALYATARGDYRLAVVGSEVKAGTTLYWMEISGTDSVRGKSVVQVLIPGYPYQPDGIEAMVIQVGSQPPVKMPDDMIIRMRSQLQNNETSGLISDCGRWTVMETEAIPVGAGTVEATHLQDPESGSDVWVAKQVPFGVVKANTKASGALTLVGYGSDAKSSLTGPPIDMGPMPNQ